LFAGSSAFRDGDIGEALDFLRGFEFLAQVPEFFEAADISFAAT